MTVVAAPPAGDLDQCANGGVVQTPVLCGTGASWQNGNLNANQAHYNESESVPYRLRLSNLSNAGVTHTVVIEWDTTVNGKHALDYITSFNRTETNANPCQGVANCSYAPAATPGTFGTGVYDVEPIPVDQLVTAGPNGTPGDGDDIAQAPGDFILFGNTNGATPDITSVSAYTVSGTYAGTSSTRITISFTTPVSSPVLAWGGHIAARVNWGVNNSAVAINGSPFHMRLISVDGKGGNQDRSLSNDAVIFPASVTIIKDVAGGEDARDFTFTTGGTGPWPDPSFQLDDDSTDPTLLSSRTYLFSTLGVANTRTVTESDPAPAFALTGLICTEDPGGIAQVDNSTTDLNARTATLILEEAEIVTCTFTNTRQQATLTVIKHVTNDTGGTATASDFTMSVTGTNVSSASFPGSESGTQVTLDEGAFSVGESGPAGYARTDSGSCTGTIGAGELKTCTITNDDQAPSLTLVKIVANDDGGTAVMGDFTLTATGPTSISGAGGATSGPTFKAGTYALSETTSLTGYTQGTWACAGGTQNSNLITLALGESATCTITNDDQPGTLIVRKVVINDNGGTLRAQDFSFQVNGSQPVSFEADGQNDLTVAAGTYSVTEPAADGYATSYDNCSSVVIPNGGSATCTITNDDDAVSLTLVKYVTNDNGGTAVAADFTLTATGPTPISGPGGATSDATFSAGTYTLSETSVSGYTGGAWSCTGGAQNGNQITLALGESATCEITNDDQTATLIVRKVVVNDNGGALTADKFSFMVNEGAPVSFEADGQNDRTVDAGTYTITEPAVVGYTTTYDNCAGVVLANGGTATCTITNDDQPASPELSTGMLVTLNDSATLTGLRPNGGAATVEFKLFANDTCSGEPLWSQTRDVPSVASSATVSTVGGYDAEGGITYYWTADYSGNAYNSSRASGCGDEAVTITVPHGTVGMLPI